MQLDYAVVVFTIGLVITAVGQGTVIYLSGSRGGGMLIVFCMAAGESEACAALPGVLPRPLLLLCELHSEAELR